MARRLRYVAPARLPYVALAIVAVLSLTARLVLVQKPCRSPCRTASDHLLIFDEAYYVNAARVIAGVKPPAGAPYAKDPRGDDGNAEHPQLAKLIMAGSIEVFGDGPFAWRLGSIVCGALAVLGTFALVRAAGGGPWLGVGAATLLASDNLLLVHGRIGTLDIYAVAAMIWAVAAYLRGRPLLAGVLVAVGACAKEVAPYALLVLAVIEALRTLLERRDVLARLARLAGCWLAAAVSFVGLLELLDLIAPPYDDAAAKAVKGGAFHHIAHILTYASHQTSPQGPRGIASYPWQWLVDYKPITYLNINPAKPSTGLFDIHPSVHFLGMISPPVLAAALPGLVVVAVALVRRAGWRGRGARDGRVRAGEVRDELVLPIGPREDAGRLGEDASGALGVGLVGLAWFIGTFVPFVLLSLLYSRTSYLYYMVVVMPGLYMVAAYLVARIGPRRKISLLWMLAVAVAAIVMFPFTPLP